MLVGECEVAPSRCGAVIQAVASHVFHATVPNSDLPSTHSALRFADRGHVLSKMQLSEALLEGDAWDLHLDGTSRSGKKYAGHQVNIDSHVISAGFTPASVENTTTLVDKSFTMLQELSEVGGQDDAQQVWKIQLPLSTRASQCCRSCQKLVVRTMPSRCGKYNHPCRQELHNAAGAVTSWWSGRCPAGVENTTTLVDKSFTMLQELSVRTMPSKCGKYNHPCRQELHNAAGAVGQDDAQQVWKIQPPLSTRASQCCRSCWSGRCPASVENTTTLVDKSFTMLQELLVRTMPSRTLWQCCQRYAAPWRTGRVSWNPSVGSSTLRVRRCFRLSRLCSSSIVMHMCCLGSALRAEKSWSRQRRRAVKSSAGTSLQPLHPSSWPQSVQPHGKLSLSP